MAERTWTERKRGTMKSWKFKLGIVAVFVLGIVVGAVATCVIVFRGGPYFVFNMGLNRPQEAVSHIMNRLDHKLKLSEAQRQAIEPIVAEGFTKMRALRARLTPEVEKLVAETSERIKPHLDPEQQRRLVEHYADVMQRWRVYAGPDPATPGPAPSPPGK